MTTPLDTIAIKVVASILGAAAQAAVKGRLTTFFDDIKRKKALESAILAGLEEFRGRHRQLANSFFDETFLLGPAVIEIRKLLELSGEPSPETLSAAYSKQFSQPSPSIVEPCRTFLEILEDRLVKSPELADLFTDRAARRIDFTTRKILAAVTSSNGTVQSAEVSDDTLLHHFRLASAEVANWPKALPGGHAIERTELLKIRNLLKDTKSGRYALLGVPGSGKSAFLSALLATIQNDGFAALAIKADTIPLNVDTERGLQACLGLPLTPSLAIRQIAQSQPVLLIVDQIDALCAIVDTKSMRLPVILRLIRDVAAIENVAVVYSCREFEHEYDTRFASLDSKEIKLELPNWESVASAILESTIDPSAIPKDLRDILKVPQHLSVFLRLSRRATIGPIPTYQAMLEQFWRAHLDARNAEGKRQLLVELVDLLQSEEELWSPRAKWASQSSFLDELIADGFLIESQDKLRIGFTHQTLADFCKIRAFLEADDSIAKYTLDRSDRLFVRPIVWSALHYLRTASVPKYRRELEALWNHDALPDHLRLLLIEFVGSQNSPDSSEIRLFSPLIRGDDPQPFLVSCRQSAGWFQHIARSHLSHWMRDPRKFQLAGTVLIGALKHSPIASIEFVNREWMARNDTEIAVASILWNIETWDENCLSIAIRFVEKIGVARFEIRSCFKSAFKSVGASAYQLLAAYLRAQLEGALREAGEASSTTEYPSLSHPIIRTIEQDTVWHFIKDCVAETPIEFLAVGLPWLERAANSVRWPEYRTCQKYLDDGISRWAFDEDEDDDAHPARPLNVLLSTFESAACSAAKTYPREFIEIAKESSNSNLAVVHKVLMVGLAALDERHVGFCIEYLAADSRRFYVGTSAKPQCRTETLIEALVAKLTDDTAASLDHAIRCWSGPFSPDKNSDAKWRRDLSRMNALARLRLLRCLPQSHLSASSIRFIGEEERRLPPSVVSLPSSNFRGGWVKSPLSLQKLKSATSKQILNLLHRVPEGVERYKTDHLIGGNLQLSREIAELAKFDPRKAIDIVEGCDPARFQTLAGLVFGALCEEPLPKKLSDPDLILLFSKWVSRGFGSTGHRDQFAWGLEKIAHREGGLPAYICDTLEEWLSTETVPNRVGSDDSGEEEWDCHHPAVFGSSGGLGIVPHGTFPILSALVAGYLCGVSQAEHRAMRAILSRRDKGESDSFWEMTLWTYASLLAKNHKDAAPLIVDLLRSRPSLRANKCALYAVWCVLGFHGEAGFFEVLDILSSDDAARSRQGAGELLFARFAYGDAAQDVETRMMQASQMPPTDPVRLGIIHSAIAGWTEPATRALSNKVIHASLESSDELVVSVGLRVFGRGKNIPRDAETLKLIKQATVAVPNTPNAAISRVLDTLPDFFLDYPEEVICYLEAVLPLIEEEIADMQTHLALHAESLVEIAIAAHRTPGFETRGLRIFERLLKRQVYKTREAITAIDRWRPV